MESVFGINDPLPARPTQVPAPSAKRKVYPTGTSIREAPQPPRPQVKVGPRPQAPRPAPKNRFKLTEEEVALLKRATRRESRELTRYLQQGLPAVLGMERALENVRVTGRDGLEAGDIQADEELLSLVTHIRKYEFLAWYLARTSLTPAQQRRWLDKWMEGTARTHYRPPTDPSRIGVIVKRNAYETLRH